MTNQFIIWCLGFFIGFFIRSLFSYLFMIGTYVKYMQELEMRFLLLSSLFIQWRSQAIKILELSYEDAAYRDLKYQEEFKLVKIKIEQKYQELGEQYVKRITDMLPYKPAYKNWDEAVKFLERNYKKL